MSSLNLKDHINSSLMGTDTTGITGSPWRVGDSISPNIDHFRNQSPSDIKAKEWAKIINDLANSSRVSPVTTTTTSDQVLVKPGSKDRTLKFKDIVFTAYLPEEVMQFFEDDRDVTRDELRLLEIAHPTEYSRIKRAWTNAWKELKALEAFEKD